jgi:hypothetical protein
MPKEKYPESFIAFMDQLKRYPLILKDKDQERLVKAGVSTVESPPINIVVEAPDTKQLRPWQPPKPLKQRILESDDPQLEVYRKLIQAWPSISDGELREILQGTPRDRIEKVLAIYKESEKLFVEFLQPNITYEEILLLDRIYRYYLLLNQAKQLGLLENLKNGFKYDVSVDGKAYQAELLAFVDNVPVSINLYPDSFNRPVLGVPYNSWPCLQKFREKVRMQAKNVSEKILELRIQEEEVISLTNMLKYLKELENSFFQLSIELFVTFPIKYTVKDGVFGSHIYLNKIQIPCSLCGKQHNIWLISKVK